MRRTHNQSTHGIGVQKKTWEKSQVFELTLRYSLRLLQHMRGRNDLANGSRLHVTDRVARRKGAGRIRRAARERAKITAAHVGLDVRLRRGGVGGSLVFQGPLLLGTVNLTEVVDAGILLRGGAGANEVGNRDGGQETDNGHDDHDFHQREALFAGFILFHNYIAFSTSRPERNNWRVNIISNRSFIANCEPLASIKQPMCQCACPEVMLSNAPFRLFSMKMTLRTGKSPSKWRSHPTQLSSNTGHCPVAGHILSRINKPATGRLA